MPGVPSNAFGLLKKLGRAVIGRNKKNKKKIDDPMSIEDSPKPAAPAAPGAATAAVLEGTTPVEPAISDGKTDTPAPVTSEITPVAEEASTIEPQEPQPESEEESNEQFKEESKHELNEQPKDESKEQVKDQPQLSKEAHAATPAEPAMPGASNPAEVTADSANHPA